MNTETMNPARRNNKTYITYAMRVARKFLTLLVDLLLLKEKLKRQAIISGMNKPK